MTTTTANALRIYGILKRYKESNPLRPICSSINSKHYTDDSSCNIKDATDFKTRKMNMEIEEDEVLISFDVTSVFSRVPIILTLRKIEYFENTLHHLYPFVYKTKYIYFYIQKKCTKNVKDFQLKRQLHRSLPTL